MGTKKSFSLYLAKTQVSHFEQLLTDTARHLLDRPNAVRIASKDFGDGSELFLFHGRPSSPKWVDHLKEHFSIRNPPTGIAPCGVLAFEIRNRIFAATFSYGHVYLEEALIEADFGLRVSINSLSDQALRGVERANLGTAIRDVAQAATHQEFDSFGFGDTLDLIRKISGRCEDEDFADKISGAKALNLSKTMRLSELPEITACSLDYYTSQSYKNTSFRIVDFLSPIVDVDKIQELDHLLVDSVRKNGDDFEISLPKILDHRVMSFRFERAKIRSFHVDLSLDLYCKALGNRIGKISADDLKTHRVAAYDEDGAKPVAAWSLYHSLIGSASYRGARYALTEGEWYRVDDKFKLAADQDFEQLCADADPRMRTMKQLVSLSEKKTPSKSGYQSESSYNSEIAKETDYLLMDEYLVPIEDVPGRGVELCDLLDLPGRRLIHVKKSSRQSSILSHFFKQGANSARMLRQFDAFKAAAVTVIRQQHGEEVADQAHRTFNDTSGSKWTVEFHIADFPRKNDEFNIPFFSKLTLRAEAGVLKAMGFDVKVRFIRLNRPRTPLPKKVA